MALPAFHGSIRVEYDADRRFAGLHYDGGWMDVPDVGSHGKKWWLDSNGARGINRDALVLNQLLSWVGVLDSGFLYPVTLFFWKIVYFLWKTGSLLCLSTFLSLCFSLSM